MISCVCCDEKIIEKSMIVLKHLISLLVSAPCGHRQPQSSAPTPRRFAIGSASSMVRAVDAGRAVSL